VFRYLGPCPAARLRPPKPTISPLLLPIGKTIRSLNRATGAPARELKNSPEERRNSSEKLFSRRKPNSQSRPGGA